jgi:hypothetical protein
MTETGDCKDITTRGNNLTSVQVGPLSTRCVQASSIAAWVYGNTFVIDIFCVVDGDWCDKGVYSL